MRTEFVTKKSYLFQQRLSSGFEKILESIFIVLRIIHTYLYIYIIKIRAKKGCGLGNLRRFQVKPTWKFALLVLNLLMCKIYFLSESFEAYHLSICLLEAIHV